MLPKLIRLRIKTFFEFGWEFWNILAGDTMEILFSTIFWYIILKKGFFGINLAYGFLFLCFQWISYFFWTLSRGFQKSFKDEITSGKYVRDLLYPRNSLLIFYFRNTYVPLGPTMHIVAFFILSIKFGLKITKNVLLGFLAAILSGILIFSFNFFLGILTIFTQGEAQRKIDQLARRISIFPTHIFKGFIFLLSNIIIPAFAYGTYGLLVSMDLLKKLTLYLTIYSSIFSIGFLFLSVYLYNIGIRRWEAYGL